MRLPRLIAVVAMLTFPVWGQDGRTSGLRLDVDDYEMELEIIPENAYFKGTSRVRFSVLEETLSLPFELNSRISLIQVRDEENRVLAVSFDNLNSSRMLVRGLSSFEAGSERELVFEFDGTLEPEQFAYLDDTPRSEKVVIGPDGALLLSEGQWFPAHRLPLDTARFQLKVSVPLGFSVVAPGRLERLDTVGINEVFTWRSEAPIGYVPVSVDRYYRQAFDEMAPPLTFYVTEDYRGDLQPLAQELEQMLDYFGQEWGPLPHAEGLNLVQIGNVAVPSTGSLGLILLESRLLNSSPAPLMEMARRIARQWWTYSVDVQSGHDVWLQEGFANYAALRYVEARHPDRYEAERARLAVEALKYEERSPVSAGLELGPGSPQFQSVVGAKGAWILYMLRQLVGSDSFHAMLKDWYQTQRGRSVNTSELIDFVNERTGEDYRWFFVQWVESTGVPEFRLEYTVFKKSAGGFRIRGQIKQDLELFRMPVDVRVETKGEAEEKHLRLGGKATSFDFLTETLPLRIELDPDGKILRDSDKMREAVHISLGEEYQAQGEFVSAIREFEKAKTLSPRSSLAHYRLGETFFQQHSYSNAANSFRDALNGDLKPDWVQTWTHIHLGKIYDILGQRERAKAEYQKALNTQVDYNGAQDEAQKYFNEPFTKPRTLIN